MRRSLSIALVVLGSGTAGAQQTSAAPATPEPRPPAPNAAPAPEVQPAPSPVPAPGSASEQTAAPSQSPVLTVVPNAEPPALPTAASAPPPLAADPSSMRAPDDLAERSGRLDAALAELAAATEISAGSAVFSLAMSGIVLTAGVLVAVDDDPSTGSGLARGALSGIMLSTGGGMLVTSIDAFGRETVNESRLDRFRAARARTGFDRQTLAGFEGELRMEAALTRYGRRVLGLGWVGLAIGGAGTIVVAALAPGLDDDARKYTGVYGGLFALIGTWQAISQLTGQSAAENVLERYETQHAGPAKPIALAPVLGRGTLGLQLSRAF